MKKIHSKRLQIGIPVLILVMAVTATLFLGNNIAHLIAVRSKNTVNSVAATSNTAQESVLARQITDQPTLKVNAVEYFGENENRHARANITITNNTQANLELSPLINLKATDDNNSNYRYTAEFTDEIVGGTIKPGETYTNFYDFNIGGRTLVSVQYVYDLNTAASISISVR